MHLFRSAFGLLIVVSLLLIAPASVFAVVHVRGAPGRLERASNRQSSEIATPAPIETASPSPESRGVLRRREHAERLVRVQGVVNGMTQKLENLATRLDRQMGNFERRIAVLELAGHAITVDVELAAAKAAVANTQATISRVLEVLRSFSDSETPRRVVREIRLQIRDLRSELRAVQAAFQGLREAIRDDVRVGRPSPTPAASPLVVSPTPLIILPSPTATP